MRATTNRDAPHRRVRPRGRRGYVIMLALLLAVLVSAPTAMLLIQIQERALLHRRTLQRVQAEALLDAGLAQVLSQLSINLGYPGTFSWEPLGDGQVRTQVANIDLSRRIATIQSSYGVASRIRYAAIQVFPGTGNPPRVLSIPPPASWPPPAPPVAPPLRPEGTVVTPLGPGGGGF
ncbi:MAG: hypothetical protein AAF772_16605 [Acidobacteriota bacterium]